MMCVILAIPAYGFILQIFLVMSDTLQRDNTAKAYGITYLRNARLESKVVRYISFREMNSAYIKHAKITCKGFANVR